MGCIGQGKDLAGQAGDTVLGGEPSPPAVQALYRALCFLLVYTSRDVLSWHQDATCTRVRFPCLLLCTHARMPWQLGAKLCA